MNPRFLSLRILCACTSGVAAVFASLVPGAASASAASTTSTTVPRLAAKASLPVPVAAVPVFEDLDTDGVSDTVPAGRVPETAPAVNPNGWRCPVANARFTNDWGMARSGGRAHEGTDMLAARGTPIFAPIAGVVRFDASSRGGLSFYLDTPSGLQLFGAHLDSYGAAGKVESGTIIGYVGDTGNARGTTHLHFEVHPSKKTKTNPYPLLKQIC
jgi:murein DD-endopeptidase MepM/ murein hydrolase activator NlpD